MVKKKEENQFFRFTSEDFSNDNTRTISTFQLLPFWQLQVSNSILNIVKNPLGLTLTAKSPPSTYCEQSRCANNKQDEEEQVCAINQRIEIVTSKKSWRCEGGGPSHGLSPKFLESSLDESEIFAFMSSRSKI